MEKSMGKDGQGEKAGKGRREKGNGGKIVDQYLNSQLPVDSVLMSH